MQNALFGGRRGCFPNRVSLTQNPEIRGEPMRSAKTIPQSATEQHNFPRREEYLENVVHLLATSWPNNCTVNIVCHGHSVPAGYARSPEVRGLDSYPHLLHVALMQKFSNAVINVIVTALGGESSDGGAARFNQDVLRHGPDLVTIDYALNDRRIGLESARKAWGSMIESALSVNSKILLLTPTLDLRAEPGKSDEELLQHAAQIRALADNYRVGLVDNYGAFQHYLCCGGKLEDLMSHSNHPNRTGHQLVVNELLKWFEAASGAM